MSDHPPRPLKILVVDDHEESASLLARLLQGHGFGVRTAGSVDAALRSDEEEPVGLLISDLTLPDGDGLELMRRLRCRHSIEGIVLSGRTSGTECAHVREAGYSEYMVKPVEFRKLVEAIGGLVSRTALQPPRHAAAAD
jgi:two-component system CheB/CheR fusion protein